ncbi:unnamed protein product [Closterium sp. Naga37s-1]|nr:unnamed protein product [Closterium sp. Naga37s-1]
MGTGLGVVGLQFSEQLSLDNVQQAAKELGSKFPFLLARVVGQGKTGGPLELHLCRDPKPITVAARSIDDVAAWEAAAPLDNDPSSLENGEESDVAKKDQGSDVFGDACGEGEKSTSAMEAEFKKLSAADVADQRGVEEEEEEEDEFEDAEDGDGDGDDGFPPLYVFPFSSLPSPYPSRPLDSMVGYTCTIISPIPQIHVYHLPHATCLALRCHRAVLDRPAVRQLAVAFVSALHRSQPSVTAEPARYVALPSIPMDRPAVRQLALAFVSALHRSLPANMLPAVATFELLQNDSEASLPPPLSSLIPKPAETRSYLSKSLSQAYDAVGYVRNAMASSHAPFQPGRADSRTNQFRSSFACLRFSKQETESLLAPLASHSCSLFSLECAAALKAVADAKQLGSRTETFNVTSIMNCRPLLDPPLPPDAMGVFTSGLPLKQPANQDLPLWDVARTVDADLAAAVGQKKQFVDMPVLELLFSTAMKTPTLSPECSQRTSFMSAITESPFPMDWPANEGEGHVDGVTGGGDEGFMPQLEGFVGPIFATHGVGPSISVGDAICSARIESIFLSFTFVELFFLSTLLLPSLLVPKKRTSRTKTKVRRAVWKAQARDEALKALSLAKSVLTGRSKSFIYVQNEKKNAAEEGTDEAASE